MTQAEHDALTGLRNHGAFQRELDDARASATAPFALLMLDLDAFKGYNDTHGHPEGDALLARIAVAMREAIRAGRPGLPLRRRRVRDHPARDVTATGAREVGGADPGRGRAAHRIPSARSSRSASASRRSPGGRVDKDGLVTAADRALYLAKPPDRVRLRTTTRRATCTSPRSTRRRSGCSSGSSRASCSHEIVERAAGLVGVEARVPVPARGRGPDGELDLVARVGIGRLRGLRRASGCRAGKGVGWAGRPDRAADRRRRLRRRTRTGCRTCTAASFGAMLRGAAHLRATRCSACIGLASGDASRPFCQREVEALARFAQLASIALDNARLFERAQTEVRRRAHAALHDHLTGLPNRTLLLNRLAEQLERRGARAGRRRAAARRGSR